MESKATPRPWFISRDPRPGMEWNNHIACAASPNLEICSMFHTNCVDDNETGEANAELIVTAVNAHDALEAAVATLQASNERLVKERDALRDSLEQAVEWLAMEGCDCGNDEPGTCALCVARAALKLVEKPQPCPTCAGRGELEDGDPSVGYGPVMVECWDCDGKGVV